MGKTSAKFGLCACGNSTSLRKRHEWICERCNKLESRHSDHGVEVVRRIKPDLNDFRVTLTNFLSYEN